MNIEKLIMSKVPEDIAIGVSLYYERHGALKTKEYFAGRKNDLELPDTRCSVYFDDLQVYCGFRDFAASFRSEYDRITPSGAGCITFDFRTKK